MIPRFIRYARQRHKKKMIRAAIVNAVIRTQMLRLRLMSIVATPIPRFEKGSLGIPVNAMTKDEMMIMKKRAMADEIFDCAQRIIDGFKNVSEYQKSLSKN
jgi:predicted secreted protein